MAEDMQAVKRRIKSIQTTERITGAMELVAASRLRKAKAEYEHSVKFINRITDSITGMIRDGDDGLPEGLKDTGKLPEKSCFVIITGSSGLCGNFNGDVIRATEKSLKENSGDVNLITIGSKGKDHFKRRGYNILKSFDDEVENFSSQNALETANMLTERFKNGDIDRVILIYTSYINTLKHDVVTEQLLPIPIEMEDEQVSAFHDTEYAPSKEEVFEYLASRYFELRLYSAAIESSTCENSARRQAMQNANDSACDMIKALQKKYNRARQEQITGEIMEIVSGSEAQGH